MSNLDGTEPSDLTDQAANEPAVDPNPEPEPSTGLVPRRPSASYALDCCRSLN